MEPDRFRETQALFARALAVVPGGIYGHQTPAMLVPGAYPYFFARGEGARIWDVDGNEYLDLMCSYGPIVLGHNHPKVEEAARHQAAEGNCFNGPGRVWVELAEHLVALTPRARPPRGSLAGLGGRGARRAGVPAQADVGAVFRLGLRGSGEAVGVRPDLSCYCRALGNGHPIAACVGREPLRDAATRVFF